MVNHRVKRLPVVNEGKELVGIVSRADVLRAIAALPETEAPAPHPFPSGARTVGEAATVDTPVLRPEASADEVLAAVLASPLRRVVVAGREGRHAIRLMMQHGVKRLVVVDDDGRFRGLVDRREVLRLLAESGQKQIE